MVLPIVPGLAEVVEVVPDGRRVGEPGVDARRGDVERVEGVSDHRDVREPGKELAVGPDALREPRAHEIIGHAPVGRMKERVRPGEAAHRGEREVTCAEGEGAIEDVPHVPSGGGRERRARKINQDVIVEPRGEDEPGEVEDGARQLDVVALVDLVDLAEVIGIGALDGQRVRVAKLRDMVDDEPEGDLHGVERRDEYEALVVVGPRHGVAYGSRLLGRSRGSAGVLRRFVGGGRGARGRR